MTEARVVLVSGPPCSGKTTYVREHRGPHDLVFDMDAIKEALGGPDHDDSGLRVGYAIAMREAMIAHFGQKRYPYRVWYIACTILPHEPAKWCLPPPAIEHVKMSCSKVECVSRARAACRPEGTLAQIDLWFAQNGGRA